MVATTDTDLILFVAGEPDPGFPSLRNTTMPTFTRLVGGFVPLRLAMGPSKLPSSVEADAQFVRLAIRPWHLPPEQIHCVNLVLEVAGREARDVTIVDVDRAGGRQDLIARWVGPNDLLPLLVRPDGARLEGIEKFVPRKVRQFIRVR
jgi:hypothetical protein